MKEKIILFIKQNQYLAVAVGFFVWCVAVLLIFSFSAPQLDWQTNVYQPGLRNARLLDGLEVHKENINLKPIAVIVENHIDARPVAGLDQASIIYEIVVEADITRLLAIFDGSFSAKKIGPVRSVRPFFVDLAEEWNPILFHAGGSAEGLSQLKNSSVYGINEISADGIYFWRDAQRSAPHNLFTSADLIKRAQQAKNLESQGDFKPWLFKVDQPSGSDETQGSFEVEISGNSDYDVFYQYSPADNDYTRVINGKTYKTDRGIVIKANNVVVQQVNSEIVDSYGRLEVDLSGSGEAVVYQDGKKILGSWKKDSNRTRFYDNSGKEIKFNRGVTWVELVAN